VVQRPRRQYFVRSRAEVMETAKRVDFQVVNLQNLQKKGDNER
jgi:hypothetical protein